jgi:hypothetical protein
MPPFSPSIPITDDQRAELLKEFGGPLDDLARLRRKRQVLRLSLELRSQAKRFCRYIQELKRPD